MFSNPIPPAHHRWSCRTGLLIGTAVAALVLAGCASPAVPADANHTAAPMAGLSHNAWWQDFSDPLLNKLITQALQANTSIRSAQAALQQARALRDGKVAAAGPSLTLSGSAQRSQTEFSDANNNFKAGLDARWEADVFGANRSSINASEADAQAAQASLRDVQVSIAAEVALAYIQLRGSQAQLAIAHTNLASQQETLQITQWRAQAGLVTSLEVEQAQSSVAQTAAQIPALQTSLAKTRHSLAILTGQRPLELDPLLTPERAVPQASSSLTAAIPANTLRQRADVRAAEHRITAALARVDAADAARYPSFSLGGSLSLSALTLAGLSNGATLAGSLLGSVSVPLFDGGAAQSQVLAQQAALEQARAAYQATVLTALKEVEDALVALGNDRERLGQQQLAARAASNAALLAQNRYHSGLIDFQTVLQTQRTLLSSQDSVASLQAELSADHVRLVKALGGGWHE
ncbi:efflux transporter outer membrane subunit [Rhodoferax sp.]|uniref:efflux transporter outer membrane subunit n=1 Tax=Rhodoferax sp. TaxID=50421 RepID=UPI00261DAD59|nr:efflux transporter outer membrane subunit [Rhodoferax sp.]MDD2924890.1 efflux transporter outer membrane subunit [Rhodoferax sp.]